MPRFPLITSVALLAATAAPLSSQTLAEACEAVGNVAVGQWAEYRAAVPQMGSESMTMRFAIVGTEQAAGTEHYWMELKMEGAQGGMIMQMLIPSWPYEAAEIRGLIMKAGNQPAMRMPEQMVSMMMQRVGGQTGFARDAFANCDGAELLGRPTVTVPAGSFETLHVRSTQGDNTEVWVSLDIPFGLVKMQGREGTSMELVGHGDDAQSSITETPVTPGG